VKAWNERDLGERSYPFVIVDAIVLKVRKDGRVRSQSALIAVGINEEGYCEDLGLRVGDSESDGSERGRAKKREKPSLWTWSVRQLEACSRCQRNFYSRFRMLPAGGIAPAVERVRNMRFCASWLGPSNCRDSGGCCIPSWFRLCNECP